MKLVLGRFCDSKIGVSSTGFCFSPVRTDRYLVDGYILGGRGARRKKSTPLYEKGAVPLVDVGR